MSSFLCDPANHWSETVGTLTALSQGLESRLVGGPRGSRTGWSGPVLLSTGQRLCFPHRICPAFDLTRFQDPVDRTGPITRYTSDSSGRDVSLGNLGGTSFLSLFLVLVVNTTWRRHVPCVLQDTGEITRG